MNTYYVSKYAATKGIVTLTDAEVDSCLATDEAISVIHGGKAYTLGKDVFCERADALRDAVKRGRRKVTALIKKEEALEERVNQWEYELDPEATQ